MCKIEWHSNEAFIYVCFNCEKIEAVRVKGQMAPKNKDEFIESINDKKQ